MYFILFCTLVFALSEAKQSVELPAKVMRRMAEKAPECIAKTGANPEVLQRLYNWEFEANESGQNFYICLFTDMGLIDPAGHFYLKEVLAVYENSDRKDEIAKASIECNKVFGKNPSETTLKAMQCFHNKSPVLLHIEKNN